MPPGHLDQCKQTGKGQQDTVQQEHFNEMQQEHFNEMFLLG